MGPIAIPRPGMPSLMGPPPVYTGAPVVNPNVPGVNTRAPTMGINQAAAQAMGLGCVGAGCIQLRDVAPTSFWARIPLWAKIGGGVLLAGGLGYGLWRAFR